MDYDFYATHRKFRKFWPLSKDFGVMAIKLSQQWSRGEVPDTPGDFQLFLQLRLEGQLKRSGVSQAGQKRHMDLFTKIIKNPASAIFLDLMRATESSFFVQWLQDSIQVDAVAMEPAYQRGKNLRGQFGEMPPYDPAVAMADDAGYEFIRWRDERASELMREAGKGAKIVSMACGTMPELRYFDYPIDVFLEQEFYCYDQAEVELLRYLREADLPTGQVTFSRLDLSETIRERYRLLQEGGQVVDLVSVKGFLSYALPKLPEIIPAVTGLLQKPGAKFAFDLQLANWTMARNKWIFLWAQAEGIKFDLLDSLEDVESTVNTIVERSSLPVEVAVEAAPGGYDAIGAFVTLTKV